MSLDSPRSRASAYLGLLTEATPRLLGGLDRESLSPTWGSFDRDHWAWKFRDFPITMMQAGVLPLAWLWRPEAPANPWRGNGPVLEWILAGLRVVLERQHRNGAFDTVAPNSMDHGVTLAQCYILATAADLLGTACPDPLTARIADALRRGTTFASRSSEDYAFISNHHALFALAWLRAGRRLADEAVTSRADEAIAGILAHQSPDGWYAEYGGPDPGYESFGLQHLAQLERERPGRALTQSIDRSLEFLSHCVQPDGGLGGGYGSRHTMQWYPAGFEILARRSRTARSMAAFLRARLEQGAVVTPRSVDVHNLPFLLHSYGLAAEATLGATSDGEDTDPLPCERESPLRSFPDSGLAVTSTRHYFALCGLKKGGALVVHGKRDAALIHEDAGYVAESGGKRWSSALLGLTEGTAVDGGTVAATARFGAVPRPVLTPVKFLVLRALNLTLFRSRVLGGAIRRMIIAQLITRRRPAELVLERQVTFEEDRILVRDRISGGTRGVTALWRPRAFTPVHMGSARYYHPRELAQLPTPLLADAAARLGRDGVAELAFSIPCSPDGATAGTPNPTT